ncbi:hypothetical protein AXA84_0092 [Candidatus Phytoplasma oryzae]|uniref:Uncharacterized protein n=1 Tax=Candidatus Phytoplasma oryzae TaxID=203274 RepID=A0A139JR34_9MOLU|nr:hypothetical protein [Candidatus Phytoplasma oryzae]KXT29447.1 hypothetical protein AXA84_0092 [Candidatus Phytoplasma oryzae]RAM58027.1 hypothetical protein DH96_00525 [Candidatus Phytoplasma oryzae]
MKVQKKNKIKIFFLIFIFLLLTFGSIYGIRRYFFYLQKKEKIKFIKNMPSFEVQKKITKKDNEKLEIIPLFLPNLNEQKYTHLIEIEHEAQLNKNSMDIQIPLFLKINYEFDTNNTFYDPEKYFNLSIFFYYPQGFSNLTNYQIYEENKKPQFFYDSVGIGKIQVLIKIEQIKEIKNYIDKENPELSLIIHYHLVNQQDKDFESGVKTIHNNLILNV